VVASQSTADLVAESLRRVRQRGGRWPALTQRRTAGQAGDLDRVTAFLEEQQAQFGPVPIYARNLKAQTLAMQALRLGDYGDVTQRDAVQQLEELIQVGVAWRDAAPAHSSRRTWGRQENAASPETLQVFLNMYAKLGNEPATERLYALLNSQKGRSTPATASRRQAPLRVSRTR
jgi:hypothetical protein